MSAEETQVAEVQVAELIGHVPYYMSFQAEHLSDALRGLADELDARGDYLLSVTTEFISDEVADYDYYAVYAVLDRTAS